METTLTTQRYQVGVEGNEGCALFLQKKKEASMGDSVQGMREGLSDLFLWWYGPHRSIRLCLVYKNQCPEELPISELEAAWRKRWFAKGALTSVVDAQVRERFGWMLERYIPPDCDGLDAMPLWERMARMVLLDQLPRSIYRGTRRAYAFDAGALGLAVGLASSTVMASLPLHFQSTVLICLCHSEQPEHQDFLSKYLGSPDFNRYRSGNTASIVSALDSISRKHAERVALFGRFPERNEALGRESTHEEKAWLAQLR